jgi:hypothetical protein
MIPAIRVIGKSRLPRLGWRQSRIKFVSFSSMETFDPNFAEFLKLLSFHRVKYLVVGGYAILAHEYASYGFLRLALDVDL